MDLRELVEKNLPQFRRLIETPVLSDDGAGKIVGWHSVVIAEGLGSFAGGTHVSRETARRIAIAECLERIAVIKFRSQTGPDHLFDRFPTSSGCAAGFQRHSAAVRSICEGLERWAWSRWIDFGAPVADIKLDASHLSSLGRNMARPFERIRTFRHEFRGIEINSQFYDFQFCVFLGFKKNGVFPGSRVTTLSDTDPWTHATIESYRHLQMFENPVPAQKAGWYFDRVTYFGRNSAAAEAQIANARSEWIHPSLLIHHELHHGFSKEFFLFRTLFHDFKAWNEGPADRFVY